MNIRALAVKKTRPPRVDVVFDDGRVLSLDPEIVVKFHLRCGQTVDASLEMALAQAQQHLEARRCLVRYLSLRKKTVRQARDYLASKGYPDAAIDEALAAARELGLLDDAAFAASYVRTQQRLAAKGPRAIEFELENRGVAAPDVQSALLSQYPSDRQRELARQAARKRLEKLPPHEQPARLRRKLYEFLLRRGFEPDVAAETIREILANREND